MERLMNLCPEETRSLLVKYFNKVIDLRIEFRKQDMAFSELEVCWFIFLHPLQIFKAAVQFLQFLSTVYYCFFIYSVVFVIVDLPIPLTEPVWGAVTLRVGSEGCIPAGQPGDGATHHLPTEGLPAQDINPPQAVQRRLFRWVRNIGSSKDSYIGRSSRSSLCVFSNIFPARKK